MLTLDQEYGVNANNDEMRAARSMQTRKRKTVLPNSVATSLESSGRRWQPSLLTLRSWVSELRVETGMKEDSVVLTGLRSLIENENTQGQQQLLLSSELTAAGGLTGMAPHKYPTRIVPFQPLTLT